MKKVVNGTVIGANAFIRTKRFEIEKEEIVRYVEIVREKAKDKKDLFIGPFDITMLIHQYPFAFENTEDFKSIRVNDNLRGDGVLNAYFGVNIPNSLKRKMEQSAQELLHPEEIVKEQPKQKVKRR